MSVELIESVEAFDACADAWDEVFAADDNATIFLSRAWLGDLYRRRPGVCILAWREDHGARRLRAFLPLRRRARVNRKRRRLDNTVCLAGNDWADHTGVLCTPGCESIAIPELGKALAELPWRLLALDSLRISGYRLECLLQGLDESVHEVRYLNMTADDGQTSLDVSPCIELPGTFEQWLVQTVSANTRQRIRRYRRRLAADPELSIRLSTAASHADDLEIFRRLWLDRWEELKGHSANYKADTYMKIIADGLASEHMRLTVLSAGDKPVAINACYVDHVRRRVSFFAGSREQEFAVVPAGLLLHADTIEWAIENGFASYDLLRGDEAYKYSLGAEDHPLRTLSIRPCKLDPERAFIQPSCRDEALGSIQSACQSARSSTIERLYGQLLESFPSDRAVLAQYAHWLQDSGEAVAAEEIVTSMSEKGDCPLRNTVRPRS